MKNETKTKDPTAQCLIKLLSNLPSPEERLEVITDEVLSWGNGWDNAILKVSVFEEELVHLLDFRRVILRLALRITQAGVIWGAIREIDAHPGLVVLGVKVAGGIVDVIHRTTLPHGDTLGVGVTPSFTL
jgi:hypothetical protein